MSERAIAAGLTVLSLTLAPSIRAQAPPAAKGAAMSSHAKGTFDVKLTPARADEASGRPVFQRLLLDKQYQGDLVASAQGEMMAAGGPDGSGAYVALETVTGTLAGRQGSFQLVHRGTMRRGGDFKLQVSVVPDSGTGGLTGLTGEMDIVIKGKEHFYEIDYSLPDPS